MSKIKQIVHNIIKFKQNTHSQIFSLYLRLQFGYVGKNTQIHPTLSYRNPAKIHISEECILREGVILDGRSDKDIGIFMGRGVSIRSYTYIDCYGGEGFVYLDDYSAIGQHVIIGGNGGVSIGKHVMISGMTYIVSATHNYNINDSTPYKFQGETRAPVIIEDNVWIASNCVVLNGVRIGTNSVVGAGSVVTGDIPPGCLAFGTPAKVHHVLKDKEINDLWKEDIS